jgi:sporulation related protein
MARQRQTGPRNWTRGAFALFWILLGCVSGLYLFLVITNPSLGGQLVKLGAPGETASATSGAQGAQSPSQELASIQENLRALSQQVATLSDRLEGGDAGNAPTPSAAEDSSEQAAPVASAEETAAEPSSPQQAPQEQKPAQVASPPPQAPAKQEAKPVEQAELEAKPSPSPAQEAAPPQKPYEPPPVAVSPLDNLPPELQGEANRGEDALPTPAPEGAKPEGAKESQSHPPTGPAHDTAPSPAGPATASSPAPSAASPSAPAPASTETAALDPIALPPAANDGSTRYGIEIGVVAKQDGLRPLWREYLTKHAALVAGLQPRRVLAPDKKWRLIAGPFASAAEAAQACALFKKASQPCEATVYAGDGL